jgi:hypothetical protein
LNPVWTIAVGTHDHGTSTRRYRQELPLLETWSMKKLFALVLFGCGALGLVALSSETAEAIPAFKTGFDKLYVKKDSTDPKEKALAEEVGVVKCNVCHVGKVKKDKNAYGIELGKLINKKQHIKDPVAIKDALEKVGGMSSNPADPKAPTYGDLIKEGKLPCPEETK